MVLPLIKCEENGTAIVSMYSNITAFISLYLIFYFLIDIGLDSIKVKLLKLNPLVESSIDCEFKSFTIYQFYNYQNRLQLTQETDLSSN
jgi:hypothetical protein